MKPYFDDGQCVIYHGDCREVVSALTFDAVVTDPPYGCATRTRGLDNRRGERTGLRSIVPHAKNWTPIFGDDSPFDPTPWISFAEVVLWGANWYADRLPPSGKWLVWEKRKGTGSDDNADCELAWTNLRGPARLYSHLWRGICREGQENIAFGSKLHPTQKPVALMTWCIDMTTGVVLDPFMGSGTTLRAAKDLGRKAIGVEIDEGYCETAAKRMAQQSLFSGVR